MLYPTHKRFGILWGLLAFPIGIFIGTVPVMSLDMTANDIFMIIICCYIGMRGALFGAEFPDIDSHTSIPRKKHPILGKVFDAAGVKHRGKYSHDFFSIGATFVIIYFLAAVIGDQFIQSVATGNSLAGYLAYMGLLVFVWITDISMVDFILWIANMIKNKKMWAIVNANRIKIGGVIGVFLMMILFVSGVLSLKAMLGGVELRQSLPASIMLVASLKVYIGFSLAVAYSHLFADMITKQGVSIFFIRISPMGVVSKVRKIPIVGKFLVPLDPKTGGKFEDLVRFIVTIACVPATFIAVMAISGV